MKLYEKTFKIDDCNSDEEYLYVDIPGYGTVCIKVQEGEGIVVDIFSLFIEDELVASTYATMSDLAEPTEEE